MSHKELTAFYLLIILFLAPLWVFSRMPLQDGPSHLAGANIIKEYNKADAPIFRKFYSISSEPVPNWTGHAVLALLLSWMSPEMAEKLLLSGYVILLPIAFRYLLGGINPEGTILAFLAFPFIYNFLFHMGFYNFVWSVALFFLVIGYWIRKRENLSAWNILVFSGLVLVLYFSHIFTFTLSGVSLALIEVWLAVFFVQTHTANDNSKFRNFLLAIGPRAVVGALAYLPAIVLAALFMVQRETVPIPGSSNFFVALNMLGSLYTLVSFEWNEIWVTRVIAACLGLLGVCHLFYKIKSRTIEKFDGFFLIFLAFVLLYFIAPNTLLVSRNGMSGGGFIKDRIGMFPFLALIIWMGVQRPIRRISRGVVWVVVGCSLTLVVMQMSKYDELSDYMQEYESALELIAPNTSVLPISFFKHGSDQKIEPFSLKVDPFRHVPEIISAKKNVVALSHYEGNMGYFPTKFQQNLNPFMVLGKLPWNLEKLDLLKNLKESSIGYPDYVVLWMAPRKDSELWNRFPVLQQVTEHYDLIFRSVPKGLALLYRKKEAAIPSQVMTQHQNLSGQLFK